MWWKKSVHTLGDAAWGSTHATCLQYTINCFWYVLYVLRVESDRKETWIAAFDGTAAAFMLVGGDIFFSVRMLEFQPIHLHILFLLSNPMPYMLNVVKCWGYVPPRQLGRPISKSIHNCLSVSQPHHVNCRDYQSDRSKFVGSQVYVDIYKILIHTVFTFKIYIL